MRTLEKKICFERGNDLSFFKKKSIEMRENKKTKDEKMWRENRNLNK